MDHLVGSVDRIVFCADETGFTVARVKVPNLIDLVVVVGTLPGLTPGETIQAKGAWKHHAQYGRQFVVESYSVETPSDIIGIQKYLESGMVKGIGPVYAKRIVQKFGIKTLEVIDSNPRHLLKVDGIGEKRVDYIAACWEEQRAIRDVMIFLQKHNLRPSLARKIFKRYGEESIEKINANPYALARSVYGIGFKSADALAFQLGIEKTSPQRLRAGLEHMLWSFSEDGHVCYPKSDLLVKSSELLEVEEALIEKELSELTDNGTVVQIEKEDELFYWIKPLYLAERGIARSFDRILSARSFLRTIDMDKALKWVSEKLYIKFAKEQKTAIRLSLEEKIHIITGGPGTGKSTITKAILRITEKLTSSILLAAPTGRAAKRMQEITGRQSSTIHSLLEYDFAGGGFKKNQDNPLECDLLIIDEASMIDTQLMNHLLKAVPSHARLILIGDIDQLPSVGPGNVLKDCIDSECLPVSRLKYIFRQAAGSKIVQTAHRINQGYYPDTEVNDGDDFLFFAEKEPESILSKLLTLIKEDLPNRFGFDPINDIQLLAPMKRGIIGTENLNSILQNALNPQKMGLQRMGREYRINDKVMQLRNNYTKKVYNGDVGRIESIDLEAQELFVAFDRKSVAYDFSELDELNLAYAVSVHKYQGSECPCVVMPVHTSHFMLLFRNLLYTGITRGKKCVALVGEKKALAIAVKRDDVKTRHTGLKMLMQEYLNYETVLPTSP